MRRTGIETLLIGLTVLALSAGVVAGMLATRLPVTTTTAGAGPGPGDALCEQLQLDAHQREQMREIWEGVKSRARDSYNDAQDLQHQRDQAILGMLSDEQKAKFEKLSKDFADRYASLAEDRKKIFDEAVEKTRKMLNDQQRRQYDEILRDRMGHGLAPGAPASEH